MKKLAAILLAGCLLVPGQALASGEATGESQNFALYPTAGFAKTFDGYKDW